MSDQPQVIEGDEVTKLLAFFIKKNSFSVTNEDQKFKIPLSYKALAMINALAEIPKEDIINQVLLTIVKTITTTSNSQTTKTEIHEQIYEVSEEIRKLLETNKYYYVVKPEHINLNEEERIVHLTRLDKDSLQKIWKMAGLNWVEIVNYMKIVITTITYEKVLSTIKRGGQISKKYLVLLKFLKQYGIWFGNQSIEITAYSWKRIFKKFGESELDILRFIIVHLMDWSVEELHELRSRRRRLYQKVLALIMNNDITVNETSSIITMRKYDDICLEMRRTDLTNTNKNFENAVSFLEDIKNKKEGKIKEIKGKCKDLENVYVITEDKDGVECLIRKKYLALIRKEIESKEFEYYDVLDCDGNNRIISKSKAEENENVSDDMVFAKLNGEDCLVNVKSLCKTLDGWKTFRKKYEVTSVKPQNDIMVNFMEVSVKCEEELLVLPENSEEKALNEKLEAERLAKLAAAKLEAERIENERLAKLEAERIENERLAKLEAERIENERLAKLEAERIENERLAKLEAERIENERLAKLEAERIENERLAKLEAERIENERLAKLEAERIEKERLEKLEAERIEKERLEKLEAERIEKERLEKLEAERIEKERLEKLEAERIEKERLEKLEADRIENERLAKLEAERIENERLAKLEAERIEKERLEKLEAERIEKERLEKLEAERIEKERLEKLEAERIENERLAKLEADRIENERLAKLEADRIENERLAKLEAERIENERLAKLEAERIENERLAKLEAERIENERLAKLEAERIENERLAKLEAERIENERLAKLEAERIEKERLEKLEAERIEKERLWKEKLLQETTQLNETLKSSLSQNNEIILINPESKSFISRRVFNKCSNPDNREKYEIPTVSNTITTIIKRQILTTTDKIYIIIINTETNETFYINKKAFEDTILTTTTEEVTLKDITNTSILFKRKAIKIQEITDQDLPPQSQDILLRLRKEVYTTYILVKTENNIEHLVQSDYLNLIRSHKQRIKFDRYEINDKNNNKIYLSRKYLEKLDTAYTTTNTYVFIEATKSNDKTLHYILLRDLTEEHKEKYNEEHAYTEYNSKSKLKLLISSITIKNTQAITELPYQPEEDLMLDLARKREVVSQDDNNSNFCSITDINGNTVFVLMKYVIETSFEIKQVDTKEYLQRKEYKLIDYNNKEVRVNTQTVETIIRSFNDRFIAIEDKETKVWYLVHKSKWKGDLDKVENARLGWNVKDVCNNNIYNKAAKDFEFAPIPIISLPKQDQLISTKPIQLESVEKTVVVNRREVERPQAISDVGIDVAEGYKDKPEMLKDDEEKINEIHKPKKPSKRPMKEGDEISSEISQEKSEEGQQKLRGGVKKNMDIAIDVQTNNASETKAFAMPKNNEKKIFTIRRAVIKRIKENH